MLLQPLCFLRIEGPRAACFSVWTGTPFLTAPWPLPVMGVSRYAGATLGGFGSLQVGDWSPKDQTGLEISPPERRGAGNGAGAWLCLHDEDPDCRVSEPRASEWLRQASAGGRGPSLRGHRSCCAPGPSGPHPCASPSLSSHLLYNKPVNIVGWGVMDPILHLVNQKHR